MDINTLKLFAEYNKKTNSEMNTIIQSLTPDQWEQEFAGYFNSIQSLCNHIYICDFHWLKRFSRLRNFKYIKNEIFDNEFQFGTVVLKEIEAYIKYRQALDDLIIQFVNEITPSDLDKHLKYIDSHNYEYKKPLGALVIHMFNHQTHHRGMISIYLENLTIQNDFSNLADML